MPSDITRAPTIVVESNSLPSTPLSRTVDAALAANRADGQPVSVRRSVKVNRARLRVGAQSGDLSVGVYDSAFARRVTSGAVGLGPPGALEVALPPTTLKPGQFSLWLSMSDAIGTVGVNGTAGDLVGGMKVSSGAHPLPATLTGIVPLSQIPCVQLLAADATPLSASTVYARTDIGVSVIGQRTSNGRLYGVNATNGHWVYSDTNGTTWTDTGQSPSVNPGGSVIELVFHSTFMYAVTIAGKVWRNTIDTFTGWTDVSVSATPAGTTGRPGICVSNGTYLFYGNYNSTLPGDAYVWRSADDGTTWVEVLHVATARHVHAIAPDPANLAHIFATLGDASQAGNGLYYSASNGAAASFVRISSNRYGINLAFPPAVSGVPARIILEGDGVAQPHLLSYYLALAGATDFKTDPLVWPDTAPASGASWAGTARSLAVTSEGNIVWISTAENGAVGTRDGLWMARGPWFTTPVLLEELTGAVWPSYGRTYESGAYLLNYRYRMLRPKFAGQ
jgi:hypothetical protein